MPNSELTNALANLGEPTLTELRAAQPARRRQILVDEGLHPRFVAEFDGLQLTQQGAILVEAYRASVSARTRATSNSIAEARFRRQWSALTGTEDFGPSYTGDIREEPGTGAIDFSRLRIGRQPK